MLYARKGEMVFCENGHEIGPVSRDLYVDEISRGDEIEGLTLSVGECFPRCKWCDGWFTWQKEDSRRSGFIFAEGIREFGPPDQLQLPAIEKSK